MDCDKELKLNDPLLSSFPMFNSPHSSQSTSVPSSPSSISTDSSTSKRYKSSKKHQKSSPYQRQHTTDDEDDEEIDDQQRQRKKNKYHNTSSCTDISDRSNALSLKDPMMSASHSPPHFSNDLNTYVDHMFFSSQYLSPSLSSDDTIDLCTILKSENPLEYDHDIMIG